MELKTRKRGKTMNTKMWALIVVLAAGAGATCAAAQPDVNLSKAVAQLHWTKLRGRVVSLYPRSHLILISDRDGNVTSINVDRNVQILRSYRVIDFQALRPEDKVELRYVGEM